VASTWPEDGWKVLGASGLAAKDYGTQGVMLKQAAIGGIWMLLEPGQWDALVGALRAWPLAPVAEGLTPAPGASS
jgi:hypothetical protein